VASYQHAEGICLRRIAFSNTSQVADFLTSQAGRLSVMAKGVTRAPRRGVRTGFDLLGRYELLYTRRRGSLQNLTSQWLLEGFVGLRRELPRMLAAYYAAELMLSFTVEDEACPGLYALLVDCLRSFADGRDVALNVLRLELGALREHGSCPSFDSCAACEGTLPARGAVTFSLSDGGPLCRRCERELPGRPGLRTTTARADLLRLLAAFSSGAERPAPAEGQVTAMSALLRFHIRDLLGRELRMWRYLHKGGLSRSLQRARRGAGVA
jgi:DNA repair protein RecO